MVAYIKIKTNLFYKLENGKVTSINIDEKYTGKRIKDCKSVPTAYVEYLSIIHEIEYNNARILVDNLINKNNGK